MATRPTATSDSTPPGPGDEVRLHFVIPSDLERGREVQSRILEQCKKSGFGDEALFAVRLALDESVTNAIKHGNKSDPTKQVEVEARVSSEAAQIRVRDEGPGFRRHEVPDPTALENLEKCSGRGILLIEAYMSDVRWSPDGRQVEMTRHNSEDPPHIDGDE